MASGKTLLTVTVADHPLYAMLAPIPFVCFLITFFTDWTYAETADMQWANMSAWLLAGGLIISIVVVIIGLIDFFSEPRLRASLTVWVHGVGYAIALLLSILNSFVHSRDAYTSVVPTGLTLSAVVAVILLISAWSGWSLIFRPRFEPFPEHSR
jgi:uncharacterized membrane protein